MPINQVAAVGNLMADPVLHTSVDGRQILDFVLVVNERWKSGTGRTTNHPIFVPCALFGPRANDLNRMLGKGDRLAIAGSLRNSCWTSADGEKRNRLEVKVTELEFLSRPTDRSVNNE